MSEKAFVSHLMDIFGKVGSLNKQLQDTNMALIDMKAKIFAFIAALELWQIYLEKNSVSFTG